VAAGLLGVSTSSAHAVSLEPVGTYAGPVYVTSDPNDETRLFVVEKAGRIELTTPQGTTSFLDQTAITLSTGERGLLSMAFAPDFATSHRFYVVYNLADGSIQLDELVASGDTADTSSRRPVLNIPHPVYGNHNGGQLQFGPDGYLYLSTGDGGGGGDPNENAQNTSSLLGKLLRIDPQAQGEAPYTVPADNPFVGVAGADEIWSYGLRNPWRFSFDRATGALVIADVGQGSWEEIDYEPPSAGGGRGDNFGWDCREGAHDYETTGCAGATFTDPVFEYGHTGDNCAITGGYVVHDSGIPELAGRYLYADLCVGQIRSAALGLPAASGDRSEGLSVGSPSTFGEDACGRLYVASLANGVVSRIVGDSPTDCDPPAKPAITDTDPDSPANDNHPEVKGTAETGSTVRLYQAADCSGSVEAHGTAAAFGSPGLTASVPDDSTTHLSVTATDPAGNTSRCSDPVDYVEDSTQPPDCSQPTSGTPGDDTLTGGPLGDLLIGRGGDDELRGRGGNDCLRGGDGKDHVFDGPGADTVAGGPSDDVLRGGPGVDELSAGAGSDRIDAAEGASDQVRCGPGPDLAIVDSGDTVAGCERVRSVVSAAPG
jgi:glucose/arabinose dehydrogenase